MAVGAGVRRTVHRADAFDRSEDIKIESALRGKSALTLEDIVDFKPAGFCLKESNTAPTFISWERDTMHQQHRRRLRLLAPLL